MARITPVRKLIMYFFTTPSKRPEVLRCPPKGHGFFSNRVNRDFHRAGFTLLEIMIALAIVGIAVTTILYTVNYQANVAYEDTLITKMVLLARGKITDMETKQKNEEGVFPEPDAEFSYKTLVKDTEDEGIVELKVIVMGYDKKIELSELAIKKEVQNSK